MPTSLRKTTTTLITGSMAAQLIVLLTYPIVTRLYTPEDFGIFNIFYSYIEIFIILSTGKYELALPLAATDDEAMRVKRGALRLNALVSLLLLAAAAVLVAFDILPARFHKVGSLVTLIPLVVFFSGRSRIYSYFLNRYDDFTPTATSEVVCAASTSALKIAYGVAAPLLHLVTRAGLPLATLLGQAAGNINYVLRLRHRHPAAVGGDGSIAKVMRRHRNFPFFVMPKDFANSFSYNLPFVWMALYFDEALAGLFALALTFTFRPTNIVNSAFERVLYARTAEKVRRRLPIAKEMRQVLFKLNVVAVPCFVAVFVFAGPIFSFVFGEEWGACGVYVRWLLPWTLIALTSTSLSFVSNLFSTQKTELRFYLLLLLLRVGATGAGIVAGNFLLGAALFATVNAIMSLVILVWYWRQIRRWDNSLTTDGRPDFDNCLSLKKVDSSNKS